MVLSIVIKSSTDSTVETSEYVRVASAGGALALARSGPYFDPSTYRLARAGLANRLLDRHEVVTIDGDVITLRQATP